MGSPNNQVTGVNGSMPLPPGLSEEAIPSQLERILASPSFAQAEALRRLLRYLVEQTLHGRADQLKEYTLAVDVFDRGESFDHRTDAIVRVQAGRLRAKLEQFYGGEGRSDQVVIELPKGSYVPVFRLKEPAETQETRSRARLTWMLAASSLAVGLSLVFVLSSGRHKPANATKTENPAAGTSVAVLPFTNLSPEPDQDYFCDGIADEISNALAQVAGLRVAARTSAFQFKGKNTDVREIARRLNVGAVVEGSVRKAGDRLRVTAQLISAADGYRLWSETYERAARDVFAIQDQMAHAIVSALRRRIGDRPDAPRWGRYTNSLEAYQLYLRARNEARGSSDSIARTMSYYQQALAIDPRFAPALAGVAKTYIRMAFAAAAPPREVMPKAREAAQRALQIDETLPEAHLALAHVKAAFDWDGSGAEREYRRALEINPNFMGARITYAGYLSGTGRTEEAIDQIERVRLADPLSADSDLSMITVIVHFNAGEYDRVIQACRSALAADPGAKPFYYWMGRTYTAKSQLAEAVDALEKALPPAGQRGAGFGTLGAVYARLGRKEDAQRLLVEAIDRSKRAYVSPVSIATIYVGLGDRERALEWLERGYTEHDYGLASIRRDPAFDPLRGERRFQALLRRVHPS